MCKQFTSFTIHNVDLFNASGCAGGDDKPNRSNEGLGSNGIYGWVNVKMITDQVLLHKTGRMSKLF